MKNHPHIRETNIYSQIGILNSGSCVKKVNNVFNGNNSLNILSHKELASRPKLGNNSMFHSIFYIVYTLDMAWLGQFFSMGSIVCK